jgi:hypothetical protein
MMNKISQFKQNVTTYKALLEKSLDSIGFISRNDSELTKLRTALIADYAQLEETINRYSQCPIYTAPIYGTQSNAYGVALSTSIPSHTIPTLNMIIDDLTYIEAKMKIPSKKQSNKPKNSSAKTLTVKEIRAELLTYFYNHRTDSFTYSADAEFKKALNIDHNKLLTEIEYLVGKGLISQKQKTMSGDSVVKITALGIDEIEENNTPATSTSAVNITDNSIHISGKVKNKGEISTNKKVSSNTPSKNTKKEYKWFWWLMGIIGAVIAGLILAFLFGVGK